jgi:NADPH2:quinone reductase
MGIASGQRVNAVRAAGASLAIDRSREDVREAVLAHTKGVGASAVFDPIGASTYETSLQLLAPRGCLINYGELAGPVPSLDLRRLFSGSLFVTKYNGMRWVEGFHEFASLIADGLRLAAKRPAIVSEVAGRFPLDRAVEAYQKLESDPDGKVLVMPEDDTRGAVN